MLLSVAIRPTSVISLHQTNRCLESDEAPPAVMTRNIMSWGTDMYVSPVVTGAFGLRSRRSCSEEDQVVRSVMLESMLIWVSLFHRRRYNCSRCVGWTDGQKWNEVQTKISETVEGNNGRGRESKERANKRPTVQIGKPFFYRAST
jgi:hypothetical protein